MGKIKIKRSARTDKTGEILKDPDGYFKQARREARAALIKEREQRRRGSAGTSTARV